MKTHYYTKDIVDICDSEHLTVDEIFKRVKEMYPEAGKSSIYRNVEELVTEGLLKKVTGVGKKSYFERNKWVHIHLVDKNTWLIIDLDETVILPELPAWFKAESIDLKVFGEFV